MSDRRIVWGTFEVERDGRWRRCAGIIVTSSLLFMTPRVVPLRLHQTGYTGLRVRDGQTAVRYDLRHPGPRRDCMDRLQDMVEAGRLRVDQAPNLDFKLPVVDTDEDR